MQATRIRVVLLSALFAGAVAFGATDRSVPLAEHGTLTLTAPDAWKMDVAPPPDRSPPTIRFTQGSGPAFEVLITPVWPPLGVTNAPDLRRLVTNAAKEAEAQSVERSIAVKELSGTSGPGYYFSATDRAPKPGEFKYMTQGMIRTGGVALTFTFLANDGQADVVTAALEMLRTARHAGGAAAPPQSDQALSVTESADTFRLSVPVSRLEMTIPKGAFSVARVPAGGATANPRYFQLDDAHGVIVSGWFESAAGYKGIDAFWKGEAGALGGGRFAPRNTKLTTVGKWETIFYDVDVPNITNTHIRAEWAEQGTWIDVHISVTTQEPNDVARDIALRVLNSIQVRPVR
jgi:hypothetical protein